MRILLLMLLLPVLVSCQADDLDSDFPLEPDESISFKESAEPTFEYQESSIAPALTFVEGRAYRFDWTFGMLEGGAVTVVERPDIAPVITDVNGFFRIDGLNVGQEATFLITHPIFYPTQTVTFVPDQNGIDDVSFQVPPRVIVWGLALVLFEFLDPTRCQIATTATVEGGNPFSTGLDGVRVGIYPRLPEENGPFYFQIIEIPDWPMLDLPMRGLTETTADGGAVFINVPPGEYLLHARSDIEIFTRPKIKCRPGVLVNASPPYGVHPFELIDPYHAIPRLTH